MLVQETIQPLLRAFYAGIGSNTNTSVISIANAQAVRIVAHTGTITGTGSAALRVLVNTTNNVTDAVEVEDKAIATLESNSSYEIFVSGAEAYAALERAAYLFVRVAVTGTPTVPIAIEISAFPGRDIPAALPSGWTRIL